MLTWPLCSAGQLVQQVRTQGICPVLVAPTITVDTVTVASAVMFLARDPFAKETTSLKGHMYESAGVWMCCLMLSCDLKPPLGA